MRPRRLGCVHQVGKQRQDDGNKDGAKEEYQRCDKMGVSKDADEQIPAQEKDQEDKRKGHPTHITGAVSGKHILGGTDKAEEPIDVPDHERRPGDDKRDNQRVHLPKVMRYYTPGILDVTTGLFSEGGLPDTRCKPLKPLPMEHPPKLNFFSATRHDHGTQFCPPYLPISTQPGKGRKAAKQKSFLRGIPMYLSVMILPRLTWAMRLKKKETKLQKMKN